MTKNRDYLTTDVDFDLTEVNLRTNDFSLHDEISAPWHVAITLEINGDFFADDARVLATHIIVPQSRS